MPVVIVLGAQWGDEGKAKVIDHLAEAAQMVVRYQGGCNAGHTVVRSQQTFKFHLIPSGILYPEKTAVIGPGTVIAVEVLQQELDNLHAQGIPLGRLVISPRAHLTFPHHMQLDQLREERMGQDSIGTTRRGIGPTYEDKVARYGLRVCDLFSPAETLKSRLEAILAEKNPILTQVYKASPVALDTLLTLCQDYRTLLEPYVIDTDALLYQAAQDHKNILLEGAQGTMLDVDYGTYPFVTSSNPTAGGACTGSGLAPRWINRVIGVTKAYTTRVGNGPFPTELTDATGEHLVTVGAEFGTTTGRKRRCGWLDLVALRYAAQINGLDGLAITKLDVLSGLPEIKLAVAYRDRETGILIETFPPQTERLWAVEPVYETFSGWSEPLGEVRTWEDLPMAAQTFLTRLSALVDVPITLVSVGADRDQTIMRQPVFERVPTSAWSF